MAKKEDILVDNGAGFDVPSNPFEIKEIAEDAPKTAAELMEMTGKELAAIAAPYMPEISQETIAKWAKKDIVSVILKRGREVKQPTARAARTKPESDKIITAAIDFMEGVKQSRLADKEAKLYAPVADGFRDLSTNVMGEYLTDTMKANTSKVLLGVFGAALLIDATIGFANVYEWAKKRFVKKNDTADARKQA